jgi:excisionase family DNA binding protein
MSAAQTNPILPARTPGSPWPIPEAAAFLTVSERHLYRLLDARKVRSVRLGRRRLIPDDEVRRLAREGC